MRDIQQDVATVLNFYRKFIRAMYNSEYKENIKFWLNREHSSLAIKDECEYLKLWLEED